MIRCTETSGFGSPGARLWNEDDAETASMSGSMGPAGEDDS
jgi:hypothetical protein